MWTELSVHKALPPAAALEGGRGCGLKREDYDVAVWARGVPVPPGCVTPVTWGIAAVSAQAPEPTE